MAASAFSVTAAVAMFVVLAAWGLLTYGGIARRQVEGRSAFAVAVLIILVAAPLLAWAGGTHLPLSDYARITPVTGTERLAGRISTFVMIAILTSAALYLLSSPERVLLRGRSLWMGYLAFAWGLIIAMAFGTRPGFRYTMLFAPAAMTIVYLCMRSEPERWTVLVRRTLMIYVWGSLVTAIARPDWAFDPRSRATVLLGTSQRLVGLTPHSNALGPVAGTALLIVIATSRARWRVVNGIAAATVLVLTDSRAAIVGTVFGLVIMFVHQRDYGRALRSILVASVISVPLLLVLASPSPLARLGAVSDGSLSNQQVTSLGGRLEVWRTTLNEWRHNPTFGYGPSLWSPEYRRQFGSRFDWVGQAHNQLIESLGSSGLVGLAGLLIYVAMLIRTAIRTSVRSHGLTGALVALLLFRMLSESALRNPAMDIVTLLHTVTFVVLLAYSAVDDNSGLDAASHSGIQGDPARSSSI